MSERHETARAHLTLRLRETLRRRLEAKAQSNGWSLNIEMAQRLEASLNEDDLGNVVFGDEQMFGLVDTIARLIRAVEINTGKRWWDDRDTQQLAADMVYRFLRDGPEFVATVMAGKTPSPALGRSAAERYALTAIVMMLQRDIDRRTEDAPPAEEAAEQPVEAERRKSGD